MIYGVYIYIYINETNTVFLSISDLCTLCVLLLERCGHIFLYYVFAYKLLNSCRRCRGRAMFANIFTLTFPGFPVFQLSSSFPAFFSAIYRILLHYYQFELLAIL